MTKPKRRGGIISPPICEGHHAVHDAPDNPPSIPRGPSPMTEEDPGRNPPGNTDQRRSSQLQPAESTMLDTGDEPVQRSTNLELVEPGNDRESDHDRRSAQNSSSRHCSSALTPLEEGKRRRDYTRSPIKRIGSESSLAGEDLVGSDCKDQKQRRLCQLERDVCMANEHLQQACYKLEDELTRSLWDSKRMSSQEDTTPRQESEGEHHQA